MKTNKKKSYKEWGVAKCRIIQCLAVITLIIAVVSITAFYMGQDLSPIVDIISLVMVGLLVIMVFSHREFFFSFKRFKEEKEDCQFLTKDDCPYPGIDDCPYNTNHCCAYKQGSKTSWKHYTLWIVFGLALVIFFLTYFIPDSYDGGLIDNVLRNVSLSVIVAAVMAFLVDIPGKMKEYQSYFVDLLSSNDYLKSLDEDELMKLREKITWILHVKDIPSMPKGLIRLDNKLCDMLRQPYFKEYTQYNDVRKDNEQFVKSIKTNYRAFNPYRKDHEVKMDIGLGIEMVVPNDKDYNNDVDLIAFVSKSVKISHFSILVDDNEKEEDLISRSVFIVKRVGHSFMLNQDEDQDQQKKILVYLVSRRNEMPLPPVSAAQQAYPSQNAPSIQIIIDQETQDVSFNIPFRDKIKVQLEYTLRLTDQDKLFTKRLRYPVKYFHLEYALKDMLNYKLDGQILGTMIDPQDYQINLSKDKKRVTLKTHSWLLPRNGVVVVINNDEKS